MIHLAVDGPFFRRFLIIASVMLHARRTQQSIHLYWKNPVFTGENFDQYFQIYDDLKMVDWFPELETKYQSFHSPKPQTQTQQTQSHLLGYHVIPPQYDQIIINLPNYLLGLPELVDPIFLRQDPNVYTKSEYEKLLSKFVRKMIPHINVIKQIQLLERQVFEPKLIRIGIFLTIEDKYYPIIDTIIKQIIQNHPNTKYQIFMSCNFYHFEEELRTKFPTITTFNSYTKRMSQTAIGKTHNLIDTYLYSSCQHLIMINFGYQPYLGWLLSKDSTQLQLIKVTEN